VASSVVNAMRALQDQSALPLSDIATQGLVEYIPFPDALRGKYQCYTQADLTALRSTGCDHQFVDVQTGVGKYVQWLHGRG
jgi:ADP-L-glycero-D-manno-heptose 6-epimerase